MGGSPTAGREPPHIQLSEGGSGRDQEREIKRFPWHRPLPFLWKTVGRKSTGRRACSSSLLRWAQLPSPRGAQNTRGKTSLLAVPGRCGQPEGEGEGPGGGRGGGLSLLSLLLPTLLSWPQFPWRRWDEGRAIRFSKSKYRTLSAMYLR